MSKLGDELKISDHAALLELKAEIRREARKRCLDEIEALSTNTLIEAGVGCDVYRVYKLAVQRELKKDVSK